MRLAQTMCLAAVLVLLPAIAIAESQNVRLENMTQPNLSSTDIRVLVLPIGSTEPHANHLCYGNDTWTAGTLAERAASKAVERGARVLVLPTMPYGVNTNLRAIPYAQSIRPATMSRFLEDIVETAEIQGIRRLLIVNSHGGNKEALGAALRDLAASHPKVFVAMVEPAVVYHDLENGVIERPGAHASEAETSVSLALFPAKVDMNQAAPPREAKLKVVSLGAPYVTFIRPWQHVSDNTGVGDPVRATPDKGKVLVAAFVERIAALLKELSDAELTDTFPY